MKDQQGLLKDFYDDELSQALKRKRKKLAETKLGLVSEEEEGNDDSP